MRPASLARTASSSPSISATVRGAGFSGAAAGFAAGGVTGAAAGFATDGVTGAAELAAMSLTEASVTASRLRRDGRPGDADSGIGPTGQPGQPRERGLTSTGDAPSWS